MKKQDKKSFLTDEEIQHTKYRWEYLRRNPEFIKDWEQLDKEEEKEKYRLAKDKFIDKWGIFGPYSPYESYEDLLKRVIDRGDDLPEAVLRVHLMVYAYKSFPEVPVKLSFDMDETKKMLLEQGKINFEFNLRYSKKRLLKDVERIIDQWLPDLPKEKKQKNESKYHFDNFDVYLKVYDLRKEGISWAKIANTLNLNSVQTARNHHKAACELIDKGIDLYVK